MKTRFLSFLIATVVMLGVVAAPLADAIAAKTVYLIYKPDTNVLVCKVTITGNQKPVVTEVHPGVTVKVSSCNANGQPT